MKFDDDFASWEFGLKWIEGSSTHGHVFIIFQVYPDQPMGKVIQKISLFGITHIWDLTHDLELEFSMSNFEITDSHEWEARSTWNERCYSYRWQIPSSACVKEGQSSRRKGNGWLLCPLRSTSFVLWQEHRKKWVHSSRCLLHCSQENSCE